MNYILERLKEFSTWRLLLGVAALVGVVVSEETVQLVFAAVTGLITLYEAFQKSPNTVEDGG